MADRTQPGHPYPAAVRLINNRRSSKQAGIVGDIARNGQEIVVNLEDNLQVTGQNFSPAYRRAGFQRYKLINVWLVHKKTTTLYTQTRRPS